MFRGNPFVKCVGLSFNEDVGFIKSDIVEMTSAGLYCPLGGFHVDPTRRVLRAVITHAHSDHARRGMGTYYCSKSGAPLLRQRVGKNISMTALDFGREEKIGEVVVSLHPAGHILGSAQVRIEHKGQVVVVTGDHNATHVHGAAEPFESVTCDLLITESTFGLPIYKWPDQETVISELHDWWAKNQAMGKVSILPCYPLGKTQRILSALNPEQGPIALTGAGRAFLPFYRAAGVDLPEVLDLTEDTLPELSGSGFLLGSFAGKPPPLVERLGPLSHGAVSGWFQVRKMRNSQNCDRAFVLSDHSDWDGIMTCIQKSGATRVGVTHGETTLLSRYLREEQGLDAFPVPHPH